MNTTKIIKAHDQITGKYYIIEAEKRGALFFAIKFSPITHEIAKTLKSEINPLALQTSNEYPKCAVCGLKKVAHGNDKKHLDFYQKNNDPLQLIYSGNLIFDSIGDSSIVIGNKAIEYDVFLVMDASGSMGPTDLGNAAKATRALVKNLSSLNNTYHFIPFATDYTYLLKNETNVAKINRAIDIYENDQSDVGVATNGWVISFIKNDVISSKKPVRIIIVTDGKWDRENEAIMARNEILARKEDVEIMAVGIGKANMKFLNKMGTIAEFSTIVDSKKLEETFTDISKMMMIK